MSPTTDVSREEAFAILTQWIENETLVKCSAQSPEIGVVIRGGIVLDGDTLRVLSSDGAEGAFVLQADCRFALKGPRDDGRGSGATVTVTFPPDEENLFVFTEVHEATD